MMYRRLLAILLLALTWQHARAQNQISNYNQATGLAPTDKFLMQQGPVGTPYTYSTPEQFFGAGKTTLMDALSALTIGTLTTTGAASVGGQLSLGTTIDHSGTGINNNRWTISDTVLSPSVDTTNIWQNNNSNVTLNGPGVANGEINTYHGFFQTNVGASATQVETFEASAINNGFTHVHDNYLALFTNSATGTIDSAVALNLQLNNNNPAAGSVGSYTAINCNSTGGTGSRPTFTYCIRGGGTDTLIATLGQVAIGTLSPPGAGTQFFIQGADNLSTSIPLNIKNQAGTNIAQVSNDGNLTLSTSLKLGISGASNGNLYFLNTTSGSIKLIAPAGALGAVSLILPDVNGTLASTSVPQTWIGQQTFNGPIVQGTVKYTATGCGNSATVGAGAAGKFVSTTTGTCTVVLTMAGATGLTAPQGWSCFANDETTGNLMRQTDFSTTTATISGTTVSGDVVTFGCQAF
jgi:hypothetical protein